MHLSIYLSTYISVDLCMYLCIYASMSVCMSVTYVGMYVGPSFSLSLSFGLAPCRHTETPSIPVCMSVCLHVCLYACMHVGIYLRYVCIARTGMISSIYGWFEHKMDNVAVVGGLHGLVVNLIISDDPKHPKLVETDGAIFGGRQSAGLEVCFAIQLVKLSLSTEAAAGAENEDVQCNYIYYLCVLIYI